jgi:hypothetical protein
VHVVGIVSGIPSAKKKRYSVRMGKRVPAGMTDQARRVYKALSARAKNAGRDGTLKSAPRYNPNPSVPTGQAITNREFHRLYHWLNELAIENDPLAYAALLQIWLNAHGIEWPAKVFASGSDLASRGRGRKWKNPPSTGKVEALRAKGMSWGQIAVELGIGAPRTNLARRLAGDRLRKMVSKRPSSVESLDEEVTELGLQMLGIMTPQEYRDLEQS